MDWHIQRLEHPGPETKGWTRWWWYGCAVQREEIDRELQFMQEAGIGGVEIQTLYPLAADDAEAGIYNIPYFSPEFFNILDYTLKKAEELGLGVDFTLGSSWPYGGPHVPQELSVQCAIPYQIDVTGPCSFSYDFTSRVTGKIERAVMGRMKESRMLEETIVDLTPFLQEKLLFGWPWGKVLEDIPIPEGDWKIVVFVTHLYHQQAAIPARDAGGYVVDHCRKDAVDLFLKNGGDPLIERLGGGSFCCFFCDSIELLGNNWTGILEEEFLRRRGYGLDRYIYGLWGEIDDISDRIRYDYFLTMSELTIENFFENLTSWCESHGSKARIQAHGTWADILKAYGSAHIPEGETFGPQDKLEVNSIHRRFASSAAHLYNKPVVSCESFTWLRVPRFLETLEMMKAEVDAIFLDGINSIYNHGYAYSPPEAGRLGWPFYASSQINHTNTYWPFYRHLSEYIQRVSGMLRIGRPKCDIAVYLPQADIWSENQMADLHMGMKLQEYMGWGVTDKISKRGYCFDYVNDDILNHHADFDDAMTVNGNTYRVILLIGCKRLPPETAEKLESFVKSGGILIASEAAPYLSCGLLRREEQDDAVRKCMARIFPEKTGSWRFSGRGAAAIAPDRGEGLITLLEQRFRPDVRITGGGDCVGYVHRVDGLTDIYFIANISPQSRKVAFDFSVHGKEMKVFDAADARPYAVEAEAGYNNSTELVLHMEAFDSVFVFFDEGTKNPVKDPVLAGKGVFMRQAPKEITCPQPGARQEKTYVLPGPWRLEIPEMNYTCQWDRPEFWQQYERVRYYSGTGIYSSSFVLQEVPEGRAVLHLEELQETAQVRINDRTCGDIWRRPWKLEVTGALRAGQNTIEIYCSNRLINYAIDPENEITDYPAEMVDGWPYFSQAINQIRHRRIGLNRERQAIKEPIPSGLRGKVWITFLDNQGDEAPTTE